MMLFDERTTALNSGVMVLLLLTFNTILMGIPVRGTIFNADTRRKIYSGKQQSIFGKGTFKLHIYGIKKFNGKSVL